MDIAIRYNPDVDDVEIVVGDKVVDTVGTEVVESWVTAWNKKHGYVQQVKQEKKETEEETVTEEVVEETKED